MNAVNRSLRVALLSSCLLVPTEAAAQWSHQVGEAPELGTPVPTMSMQSPMTCSNGTQTVPEGAFVKLTPYPWTRMIFDASAKNKGSCLDYWRNEYDRTEPNGVRWIQYHPILPDGTSGGTEVSLSSSWPWPVPMEYDTANPMVPGAQGSFHGYVAYAGTYRFQFTNVGPGTTCEFPTQSAIAETSVNTMACLPTWFLDDASKTINFHGPLGPITIAVPTDFEVALPAAVYAAAAWQSALGREINVEPNQVCDARNPLCISFKNDHGTRQGDTGCASLDTASYNPAGEWIGSTAVRFEPVWDTAHTDRLQALIAHELGHYFGLFDRLDASCADPDSIMTYVSTPCYSADPLPSGKRTGPSDSDVLALLKSTYGSKVRTTCGW